MANFRTGYIGKSFTMGVLGIVGTLVACGGGGVTSTVASTPPSPFVLFASSYSDVANSNSPIARSFEGGNVDEFYGGNFTKGWDGLKTFIPQRQSMGIQVATAAAAGSGADYAGMVINAPNNGSLNISTSTYLAIQLGNSSPTGGQWAVPVSHETFRIELKNDTVNCATTQQVSARTTEGKEVLRTYKINLSAFQCTGGTMAELQPAIKSVVVLLKGGLDATASATAATTSEPSVGLIAFGA